MPLLLSWAVLISGAIWLADVLLLKPRRSEEAQRLRSTGAKQPALEAAQKEPVIVEEHRRGNKE